VLQALTRIRGWNQRKARLAYHASIALLLALGVFFRSHRYWLDPIGLWGD
jgi:hypothetical protein